MFNSIDFNSLYYATIAVDSLKLRFDFGLKDIALAPFHDELSNYWSVRI